MDPETKKLLEETHALAKDNHKMLRSIRRGQWMSLMSTIVIWVAVLALPLYLYRQYLQPLIEQVSDTSGVATSTTSTLLGIPSFPNIQNLINSIKAIKWPSAK